MYVCLSVCRSVSLPVVDLFSRLIFWLLRPISSFFATDFLLSQFLHVVSAKHVVRAEPA